MQNTRRRNLQLLVNKYGSFAELNRALGRSPRDTVLNGIINGTKAPNGKARNLGERLARQIEEKLGLPSAWLDRSSDAVGVDYFERSADVKSDVVALPLIPLSSATRSTKTSIYLDQSLFDQAFPNAVIEDFRGAIIIDDSMSPTMNVGDRVLVNIHQNSISTDGIYLLKMNERLFFRRIRSSITGQIEITVDKPNAQSMPISQIQNLEVIGKAVYVWNGKYI